MTSTLRGKSKPLDFSHDKGKTEQAHKAHVDIHQIIKKYSPQQIAQDVRKFAGLYGDFSKVPDYHEAKTLIANADTAFHRLPSKVRKRFNNDPDVFIDFMQSDENRAAIAEMGLSTDHLTPLPPEPPAPVVPPVETPPPVQP